MHHYLLAHTERQHFLLPLLYIREIIPFDPTKSPASGDGFISCRTPVHGRDVPVISTAAFPGEQGTDPMSCRFLILFMLHGFLVGIPTAETGRILPIADEALIQPPHFLSQEHGVLACWTDREGRLCTLLDAHDLIRNAAERDPSLQRTTRRDTPISLHIYPEECSEFQPYCEHLSRAGFRLTSWDHSNTGSGPAGPTVRALGSTVFEKQPMPLIAELPPALITISPTAGNLPDIHGRLARYRGGIDLSLGKEFHSSFASLMQAMALVQHLAEK